MRAKNNIENQQDKEQVVDELVTFHQQFSRELNEYLVMGKSYDASKLFMNARNILRLETKRLMLKQDRQKLFQLAILGKDIYTQWEKAREIFSSQIRINDLDLKKDGQIVNDDLDYNLSIFADNKNNEKLLVALNKNQKRDLMTLLKDFFLEKRIGFDKLDILSTDSKVLIDGMSIIVDALKRGLPDCAFSHGFNREMEIDNISEIIRKGFLERNNICKKIEYYCYQLNYPDGSSYQDNSLNNLAIKRREFKDIVSYRADLLDATEYKYERQSLQTNLSLKPDLEMEARIVKKVELRKKILGEIYNDVKKWYKVWGVEVPTNEKNKRYQASVIRTAFLSFVCGERPMGYWIPSDKVDENVFQKDKSLNFLFFIFGPKIYRKSKEYREEAVEYLDDFRDQILFSLDANRPKLKKYLSNKSKFSFSNIMSLFGTGGLNKYLIVKIPEIITDASELRKFQVSGEMFCFDNKWYPSFSFVENFHMYSRLNKPETPKMIYSHRSNRFVRDLGYSYTISKERPTIIKNINGKTEEVCYQASLLDDFIDDYQLRDDKSMWYVLAIDVYKSFHEKMSLKYPELKNTSVKNMCLSQYPEDCNLQKELFSRLSRLGLYSVAC